jgi:hypothetical protein
MSAHYPVTPCIRCSTHNAADIYVRVNGHDSVSDRELHLTSNHIQNRTYNRTQNRTCKRPLKKTFVVFCRCYFCRCRPNTVVFGSLADMLKPILYLAIIHSSFQFQRNSFVESDKILFFDSIHDRTSVSSFSTEHFIRYWFFSHRPSLNPGMHYALQHNNASVCFLEGTWADIRS